MSAEIELVIFDCDGVLIDSESISAHMLKETVYRYGVEIDLEYILANYIGRSYPKVLEDIQQQFSVQLPDHFEDEYRGELLAAFERELELIPGVWDVVLSLNVPSVVATSSSPKRVTQSLRKVGLLPYFEGRIFTASQVKKGKPAPDLFLLAADKMGVKPENALVIEDSRNGVQAALAAGMDVIRFVGGQHMENVTDAAGASWVFHDFSQFFERYPTLRKSL